MNEFDFLLRETVSDLAAESRPVDLTPGVRARARRIRAGRRAGYLAVLAAAVVLALFIPYLVARSIPARNEPMQRRPSPSVSGPGVVLLPGGWVVTGWTYFGSATESTMHAWALDRRTQRYVRLNYPIALPAPTGTQVLVAYPGGITYALLDLSSGQVRPLDVPNGYDHPEWSPDATRIVFSEPLAGFAVVDVATAAVRTYGIDENQYRCNDSCSFTWYPDGRSVVLAQTDTTVQRDEANPDAQRGQQLFDADTGTAGQFLPIRGIIQTGRGWSPNRRYVTVLGTTGTYPNRTYQTQVIEVATGRVVGTLPGAALVAGGWVDNQRILTQAGGLCLVSPAGAVYQCVATPASPEPEQQILIGPG